MCILHISTMINNFFDNLSYDNYIMLLKNRFLKIMFFLLYNRNNFYII